MSSEPTDHIVHGMADGHEVVIGHHNQEKVIYMTERLNWTELKGTGIGKGLGKKEMGREEEQKGIRQRYTVFIITCLTFCYVLFQDSVS